MNYCWLSTEYFEPWLQFKQPCVRQLAFCIASPNIIRAVPDQLQIKYEFDLHAEKFWREQFENYYARLIELDRYPEPLLDFLQQLKSTRLGLRFEYLLWFWLRDHDYHPFELLGHSIQKIQGARTLGELDFVLFNSQTHEIEHWEVALKYYLGENDLSLPFWFGLNRDDTLSKKLNHFTQRQFQFEHAHNHRIQKRFAVLKGQFYLPEYSNGNEIDPELPWIETQRRMGTWGKNIKKDYFRLSRHEWLCPDDIPSSNQAIWWTNGLYTDLATRTHYYMYRQQLVTYK